MRRRPIRVSLQADADVVAQYCYIGSQRPAAAERWLEALEQSFERLAEQPLVGTDCQELAPHLGELRRWPVSGFPNYLIFYRLSADTAALEIVRVFHGARELEECLTAPISFED